MNMTRVHVVVALFLAAACVHQTPPGPSAPMALPQTQRYSVLMSTNKAGTQVVTRNGDEVVVDYEYTDRGRGPKTHSVIRLDTHGVPLSMTTHGNDYLKTPVEETLSTAQGRARWKNNSESGEGPAGAFYSSTVLKVLRHLREGAVCRPRCPRCRWFRLPPSRPVAGTK